MGFLESLSRLFTSQKREAKIIVVGLDNSGKTTILNQLKPPDVQKKDIVPTVGFTVEKFSVNNVNLTCFDMSGQSRYRNLWDHYYTECNGIIFVLDSSDKLRIVVAKEELVQLIDSAALEGRNVPILFLANKMDSRNALSSVKCSQSLALDTIKNKPWHISATNALTGEGLQEGLDWLMDQMKQQALRNKK